MIVSNNNNLLNILLPNDNKILKEALKNADAQTLQKFQNGTVTVGDILKNLFEDLKTADKSPKSIENFLKDTNIFKMEQNFSKSMEQLLSQLKSQPSLEKFTAQIETLLKNITNLDENSLKQMIDKSGIFLESRIANEINLQTNKQENLPKNIAELLTQIKNLIKDIPNLEAKNITNLIDKILQTNSKQIISSNNLPTEIKTLVSNLQNLLSNISSKEITTLNNLAQKLETIINSLIQNSNNFLPKESNPIQNDMKALLLQVQGELTSKIDSNSQETLKQIDRLITQIEYHQLQSLVSNSNNVYIPFLWDILDEGSISMKKIDEDKFYCEINLSLKEYGETNLLLALYDKNKLDLTIYASKDSFKKALQEALPKLRSSLNSVDLIPVNIKIVNLKKEDTKEQKQMNQFNQNNNFINPNFGIDIRV